jgi:magnesium chelatase family protein
MIARLFGSALHGVEAFPVLVEVSISKGLGYHISGLPDDAVRESLSRIAIAIEHNGYQMPRTKIMINLSPAGYRKTGTSFDLPILLGILIASGQMEDTLVLQQYLYAGEVGLDGSVHRIMGALCVAELAAKKKFAGIIIPRDNANEAALVRSIPIYPVKHIKDVIDFVATNNIIPFEQRPLLTSPTKSNLIDLSEIVGQQPLKRAIEIAAAGSHHMIISGSPGSGKSMIARCLPSILPPMSEDEMLETTRIYSLLNGVKASRLINERPFRMIHPSISEAELSGGGVYAAPGEITFAHNGVLFMDEFSEFKPVALEALRQPMEERRIVVSRSKAMIEYPASFMLVAAMNPCLCGYFGHPYRKCTCSKRALYWYRRRISGPLLDRIDMQVESEAISAAQILSGGRGAETSAQVRSRVCRARALQRERFANINGTYANAQMSHQLIMRYCGIDEYGKRLLYGNMTSRFMSVRSLDKVLRIARTIADLANARNIELPHLQEALQYRALDKPIVSASKLKVAAS